MKSLQGSLRALGRLHSWVWFTGVPPACGNANCASTDAAVPNALQSPRGISPVVTNFLHKSLLVVCWIEIACTDNTAFKEQQNSARVK
ncbi:hypothetical protein PLICRDRAFT_53635 [Plicaturopsis crispa FD-325 SS-3]|nr:hypothetical protein PLICRDRAFT_53635 [Plicaturopsis crispa FD-325 SS-3]